MKYVFLDESGDFPGEKKGTDSRYFILCTVVMDECSIGERLQSFWRQLVREGHKPKPYFHASEEKPYLRDMVYELLSRESFTIQVTIMEKAKSYPHVRESRHKFYQYAWYYHLRFGLIEHGLRGSSEALITSATIGDKRDKAGFKVAISDVRKSLRIPPSWTFVHRPASADCCLQVADYCAWAVQRKYEKGEDRSYRHIADKINYEYDLWRQADKLVG